MGTERRCALGRPRRIPNGPPLKIRTARFARIEAGLSQSAVFARTGIPINYISEFERGARDLDEDDLAALARVYNYPDPHALAKEAAIVALEEEQHV